MLPDRRALRAEAMEMGVVAVVVIVTAPLEVTARVTLVVASGAVTAGMKVGMARVAAVGEEGVSTAVVAITMAAVALGKERMHAAAAAV
jgi:hypothetical protein